MSKPARRTAADRIQAKKDRAYIEDIRRMASANVERHLTDLVNMKRDERRRKARNEPIIWAAGILALVAGIIALAAVLR
jgi:hypothetical protein